VHEIEEQICGQDSVTWNTAQQRIRHNISLQYLVIIISGAAWSSTIILSMLWLMAGVWRTEQKPVKRSEGMSAVVSQLEGRLQGTAQIHSIDRTQLWYQPVPPSPTNVTTWCHCRRHRWCHVFCASGLNSCWILHVARFQQRRGRDGAIPFFSRF